MEAEKVDSTFLVWQQLSPSLVNMSSISPLQLLDTIKNQILISKVNFQICDIRSLFQVAPLFYMGMDNNFFFTDPKSRND